MFVWIGHADILTDPCCLCSASRRCSLRHYNPRDSTHTPLVDISVNTTMSSTSYYVVLALLVSGCCMCGVSATTAATTSVTVIDLTKTAGSPLIAVRAAAGLDNRNGAEVYTVGSDNDEMWLTQIIKVTPGVHVTSQAWAAYLAGALAKYPAIVYNASNAGWSTTERARERASKGQGYPHTHLHSLSHTHTHTVPSLALLR